MNSTAEHMGHAAARSLGLGALLAYIFLTLWSRAFIPDYDLAFSLQLPLTATFDAGCLAAVLMLLALCRVRGGNAVRRAFSNDRYAMAVCSAGLALATLLKLGALLLLAPAVLLAGDALCGLFVMLCACLWWLACSSFAEERDALRCLGLALAVAPVLFAAVCALPVGAQGMAGALVLPFASCMLYPSSAVRGHNGPEGLGTFGGEPLDGSSGEVSRVAVPLLYVATVALSFLSVDPLPDLFPVSLYFEGMIGPSLPEPGAWCAAFTTLFAIVFLLLNRRGSVSMPFVYTTGFILVALGYLTTPYRPAGGVPLAAGEVGRVITCIFALLLVRRFVAKSIGGSAGFAGLDCFLRFALAAFAAMMAADAAVVALQLKPGFDYSDFTFRTVFSGMVIGVLVVLIIRPLPMTDAALGASSAATPSPQKAVAAPTRPEAEPTPQQRVASFAEQYALSARETEVFSLIAAGRDVPYIERELVLSKSTVKTHVKHIYEKCGVSSRQDLLDLFEGREK